jgi:hypothetical protein
MGNAYMVPTVTQVTWIVIAILWAVRRRDEIPLIASVFLFYIFSFRFWAIAEGWAEPSNLSNFGFVDVTFESMIEAHGLAVLGQSAFLITYLWTQKGVVEVPAAILEWPMLRRLRQLAFILVVLCLPLAVITRGVVRAQMESGRSVAFEISNYLSLFPLALVGIAILLGALWRAGAFGDAWSRTIALLSFCGIAAVTFQASLRFQFLGWAIAVTVMLATGRRTALKAIIFGAGILVAVSAFAVAGALRNAADPGADLQRGAWERFAFAQDANMLDGFVLLRQVFPAMLDHTYGREHLEIIQRVIPRQWWPEKPVGGYMNKLGLIDVNTGFTLGISPSLFGSFFQEGAIVGLVSLSVMYGFGFGLLIRYSTKAPPFIGILIRGCSCAALIPLLRGGDLPGIFAWFGMSFWPVGLAVVKYRRQMHVPSPSHSADRATRVHHVPRNPSSVRLQ